MDIQLLTAESAVVVLTAEAELYMERWARNEDEEQKEHCLIIAAVLIDGAARIKDSI